MGNIIGKKRLTSREAARLLGISEASVKRWAEEGLLPVEKTAGGHRRFRPEDVAAFRRTKFGRADEHAPRPNGASESARRVERARQQPPVSDETPVAMFESLIAGHAEEASAILVNMHLHGHTVASIADGALCPAMRKIGDLWHAGEISIAQEHVATRTALHALQTLRGAIGGGAGGPTAVSCSVEDDFHEMPVHLAALVLESEGWDAVMLGTSTPFYALAEAVLRFAPRLVCVSSTVLGDLDRAAREYVGFREAAARVGASVVLGGAGFAGRVLRERFPAEIHADNFAQLESFAPTLAGKS